MKTTPLSTKQNLSPRWLRVAGMASCGIIAFIVLWELAGWAFDDHYEQKRNSHICAIVVPIAEPGENDEYMRCMENGLQYACRIYHSEDIHQLAACYNSHIHVLDRFSSRYRYGVELEKKNRVQPK